MVLDKMRNCIVFSGQFRTLRDTLPSIKEFISVNALDVYCQLWGDNPDEKRLEEEKKKKETAETKKKKKKISE
jgi:hypothetical protein